MILRHFFGLFDSPFSYLISGLPCFRMAELLKEMRYELDQLLAEKIEDPKLDLVTYGRGKLIIETIVHLISTE